MFKLREEYRRSEIHSKYGGNQRSGISYPKDKPYIFIFSGESGEAYGYKDSWKEDGTFSYTGEGSLGDMVFTKGNAQLRDHVVNGKRVFLFTQIRKGSIRFDGELFNIGWNYFKTLDREKKERTAIAFSFVNLDSETKMNINKESEIFNENNENERYHSAVLTEAKTTVSTRIGQAKYRNAQLVRWERRCAVTGFDNVKLLIASHILPWKDANHHERLDVDNGLLLSPNLDKLFDLHLISFGVDGRIILSKTMKKKDFKTLGISGNERINGLTPGNLKYLVRHRKDLR